MRRFSSEAWFPHPLEQVFSFFADPANLPRIMPAWQKAEIDSARIVSAQSDSAQSDSGQSETRSLSGDTGSLPGENWAAAGSELWISFRPLPFLPLRARWRARITEFRALSHFCDVQLSGPFIAWRHCHRFRAQPQGATDGTLVRDELDYELPFAPFSAVAAPLAQLNLAALFRYRQKEAARLLAGGG